MVFVRLFGKRANLGAAAAQGLEAPPRTLELEADLLLREPWPQQKF